MMNTSQREVIRSYKGLADPVMSRTIPIRNEVSDVIGSFQPITESLSHDDNVVNSLTKWRDSTMSNFLTQFKATPERTRVWLKNVLKDDSSILFLIQDESDYAIGNFVVCNIAGQSAEHGNLIRGERRGAHRIIFYTELALMHWLYTELGICDIYLHVFTTNEQAIALYSSVGFSPAAIYRLIKKESAGEICYEVDSANPLQAGELGLMKMEIRKEAFYAQYPWLE